MSRHSAAINSESFVMIAVSGFYRFIKSFVFVVLCVSVAGLAQAQTQASQTQTQSRSQSNAPPLPPPLQSLREEGAQLRYLGTQFGMDGWIAIQGGQEQYFYVAPGGEGFVMGLLFDRSGKMLTLDQVGALQRQGGQDLDLFAGAEPLPRNPAATQSEGGTDRAFRTPSEQIYADMESSNWVALGDPDAPVLYSFVDPQCPHCHSFINDLRRDYIENGLVQVRMIPVGFAQGSMEMAAFMLAVPNPQSRWYRHLDGDEDAIPVTPGINQQGVQRNMAIMQSWKLNVTPFTVYRSRTGDVKIVEGRVRDVPGLISDLAPATDN